MDQHFSGPYAGDFQMAYDNAGSDKQRRMLSDGAITSSEASEARSDVRACMDDNGYGIEWDDRGGFTVEAQDEKGDEHYQEKMDPILHECERKNDRDISLLYRQTVINPQNKDERPAIVKCFVQAGIVPKGYTVRDYDRDNEDYSFPFGEFDAKGMACLDDPLGLWAKRQ